MAAATLALLGWGVGRPAFWLDEAASVVATERSWPNLWRLLHGPDAPLVPYYAVLKVFTTITGNLVPHLVSNPEVLFRVPSVLAVVLAGGALINWLRPFGPPRLLFGTGAMFLLIGGVSRYGQEARGYAITLLLAVLSTIVWSRLVRDRRPRWMIGYALLVAALAVMQTLAASLVVAHLVAAVVTARPGERRSPVVRTMTGAAAGLLAAVPLALDAIRYGRGATGYPTLTARHFVSEFLRLFTLTHNVWLGSGPFLLLTALGLTQVFRSEYRFLARLSASWALVPPAVLLPAVLVRPNLLIGRYLMFVVPAWAILAGLGIVTVMDRAVAAPPAWFRPRTRRRAPTLAWSIAAIMVVAATVAQLSTLESVRGRAGHGEDIRPALTEADRPAYRQLPIVITSGLKATELEVYDPADDSRVANLATQENQTAVWPSRVSGKARSRAVRESFILLRRGATGLLPCDQVGKLTSDPAVATCLGVTWLKQPYQVVAAEPGGQDWSFTVLRRVKSTADRRPPIPGPVASLKL